jgi:phosphohistidine phosphatase
MKKLIIIRHGKATHELMPDRERFLTEKGIKRVAKHAEILKEKNIFPDLIVSSPAVRAYETAKIIAKSLNYNNANIVINEYFYFESMQTVINHLGQLPNDASTVFIVGHNNLWTDLADALSSKDIWHLRTAGIFGVQLDTDDWAEIFTANQSDLLLIN